MRRADEQTYYDAIGGHKTIAGIIEAFYAGVATDPELRALYPEEDLSGATHRLTMFFEQYWGGPTTYSEQRGHPRLGMRHARFAVTPRMRDLWLGHMRTAIEQADLTPGQAATFWAYVERAAHFLVNAANDRGFAGEADSHVGLTVTNKDPLDER